MGEVLDSTRPAAAVPRWEVDSVANVTAQLLCALLGDARADLLLRSTPGFAGWDGQASTLPIRYEIRPTAHRGLGIFAGAALPEGAVVHVDQPEFYVRLPRASLDAALQLSSGCARDVVEKLTHWCVLDWSHAGDGVLCELDDGRYMNDRDEDEEANVGTCWHDRHATCTTRPVEAGEELVEDYAADLLEDEESLTIASSLVEAAGGASSADLPERSCAARQGDEEHPVLRRLSQLAASRGARLRLGLC